MSGEVLALAAPPAQDAVDLAGLGSPAGHQPESVLDAGPIGGAAFTQHACGERLIDFEKGVVVERGKSLQRRVRALTPHRADLSAGGVEIHHGWIEGGPPEERVNAPAVSVLALALHPFVVA